MTILVDALNRMRYTPETGTGLLPFYLIRISEWSALGFLA